MPKAAHRKKCDGRAREAWRVRGHNCAGGGQDFQVNLNPILPPEYLKSVTLLARSVEVIFDFVRESIRIFSLQIEKHVFEAFFMLLHLLCSQPGLDAFSPFLAIFFSL